MLCPVCRIDQVIVEWGGVELDVCIEGHGIWFDAQELGQLFETAGAPDAGPPLETRLQPAPRGAGGPKRRCPRCRARMDHVSLPEDPEQTVLDRCPRGHGLWFEPGELERIATLELDGSPPQLERILSHLRRFTRPERGGEEPETQ
ncbi:MAG TPA: zf-TFIIB domain-containing protein [Myxococcota bacterium]